MSSPRSDHPTATSGHRWLRAYYFTRAAVSLGWIGLVLTAGRSLPGAAAVLLALYPAWDAAANYADAQKAGGLRANPSQALNLVISLITALAVVLALAAGAPPVLVVFGIWAILAGLFQALTGMRRWRAGAQWAMVLSGVQSIAAGLFFVLKDSPSASAAAAVVAPYAGFGAFYFLVSALWLTLGGRRAAARAG